MGRPSARPGFYRLIDVIDDDMPTHREDAPTVARVAKERGAPEHARARLRYTLTLVEGPDQGRVIAITSDEVVIGRGAECDVTVRDHAVSRKHAQLSVRAKRVVVEDLRSANGTFVAGERITERRVVADGALVQLGSGVVFRVELRDVGEAKSAERLFIAALRDPLTGLLNRRAIDERLVEEIAFARRHGTALAVLMLDVDRFKLVNDTHGHANGDRVLAAVGSAVRAIVRTEDVVARWGGEEFLVLARGIARDGVQVLAERVRRAVEALTVRTDADVAIPVTTSVGGALLHASHADGIAFVSDADGALYAAKTGGRNRVVLA